MEVVVPVVRMSPKSMVGWYSLLHLADLPALPFLIFLMKPLADTTQTSLMSKKILPGLLERGSSSRSRCSRGTLT